MEHVIKGQLLEFLKNNLISEHQHGFQAKHSTCTHLIECVDDWTLALHFMVMPSTASPLSDRACLLSVLVMKRFCVHSVGTVRNDA